MTGVSAPPGTCMPKRARSGSSKTDEFFGFISSTSSPKGRGGQEKEPRVLVLPSAGLHVHHLSAESSVHLLILFFGALIAYLGGIAADIFRGVSHGRRVGDRKQVIGHQDQAAPVIDSDNAISKRLKQSACRQPIWSKQ